MKSMEQQVFGRDTTQRNQINSKNANILINLLSMQNESEEPQKAYILYYIYIYIHIDTYIYIYM
jgi:hypothetical protein